ncbi:hypothetical protein B9Z55_023060 [Caenorhabditis nigoni]|uniref:Uncharacterized protein n=1 Tax=Caenorhabditis nigoni TaxID=1611254 RepID=A0A2G5SN92_9PELO|nr:hypothetical protein B9Z55_023060 [Caenorhabditis nigoni]
MAQPSVNDICLYLLDTAFNETKGTYISNCNDISKFFSSTKMPEYACRYVVNFFSNFMDKVRNEKKLQLRKLKEVEEIAGNEVSTEAWSNQIQLMTVAAIQNLEKLSSGSPPKTSKYNFFHHALSLPSKASENDRYWFLAARRFFEFAETATNNAVSDRLLREQVQHQEDSYLERALQILDYMDMRKCILNAALYEELLQCLRVFFVLARCDRLEHLDDEKKREGVQQIRETADRLMCRFHNRYHSPQQVNEFSQYYDSVVLVRIWIEKNRISKIDKQKNSNEDYSALFMLVTNMMRCATKLHYNHSQNPVVHYLELLRDIKDIYPLFYTQHPPMMQEMRQLMIENYIYASKNVAEIDEELVDEYEAVSYIFDIPDYEELRRCESTDERLKREEMQDKGHLFRSIYPKISLRSEEVAGREQRPTIDEPQLNGMGKEAGPIEAGPIGSRPKGTMMKEEITDEMAANEISSNSGGTAPEDIQMEESPRVGEQEEGIPDGLLPERSSQDAPMQLDSTENPGARDIEVIQLDSDEDEEIEPGTAPTMDKPQLNGMGKEAGPTEAGPIESRPKGKMMKEETIEEMEGVANNGNVADNIPSNSNGIAPEQYVDPGRGDLQEAGNALLAAGAHSTSRRRRPEETLDEEAPGVRSHKISRHSSYK